MIAALLAVAALAAPQGFSEAKPLESAASFVAGKPVAVYCANTYDDWTSFYAAHVSATTSASSAEGLTIPGDSSINLRTGICQELQAQLRHPATRPDYYVAGALQTLVHESLHARGSVDEAQTDCDAVHRVPGVAVRFFHVKSGVMLRSLMALVWRVRGDAAPVYRSVC